MKLNLYTKTGAKSEKQITLSDDVFGVEVNPSLMTKVIRVFLANQRQSNAKAKTRGEVRGGGKKPWRQKGTGRARSGSIRNPIFTGGGVAFGPTDKDNHKLLLNKKERQLALKAALSEHVKEKSLIVVEGFALGDDKRTQSLAKTLGKLKLEGKTLIVQDKLNAELVKAAANLQNVETEVVNSINAYQILTHKNIILTPETVTAIQSLWGKSQQPAKAVKTDKKA